MQLGLGFRFPLWCCWAPWFLCVLLVLLRMRRQQQLMAEHTILGEETRHLRKHCSGAQKNINNQNMTNICGVVKRDGVFTSA